ncbi:MAG: sensor histidine kinase [Acidimicrobiia bacterium]
MTVGAVAAGIAAAIAVARVNRMPGGDVRVLVLLAVGTAAAAGLLGALVLHVASRAPVARQALVVALTPVLATGAGAGLAARAMFVSSHDLAALLVVLAAAGGVGTAVGLVLAGRLGTATREVAALAERLADDPHAAAPAPATRELAALATQLAATSARLAESTARERALDASRRELVAWVSHDLRTPLAGIRAMVEALEDGMVEGDDVGRYHRALRTEADRLAGLVDDLFELSRIESSSLRLTLERVSLGDIVSDALAGATPLARAKGVHLDGTVHEPPPVVVAAAAELGRVLRNLLDNAIRHTPADGAVTIEAGADELEAFVTVHDSCGGIPPHEIDRVFDLAFRGDPARTPGERGGAGLGLAIARGLVEAHHGQIAVLNEGDGCRFTVRLPLS